MVPQKVIFERKCSFLATVSTDSAEFVATLPLHCSIFVDVVLAVVENITACLGSGMDASQGCRWISFSLISPVSPFYPKQEV